MRIIENDTVARATTQTKNGLKDVKFTDSDGNVEWKYTLSATFSYVYGSSAHAQAQHIQIIFTIMLGAFQTVLQQNPVELPTE